MIPNPDTKIFHHGAVLSTVVGSEVLTAVILKVRQEFAVISRERRASIFRVKEYTKQATPLSPSSHIGLQRSIETTK
jgi:HKD family nuclease